jgi:steroid 5-alpha reductase family enzyme
MMSHLSLSSISYNFLAGFDPQFQSLVSAWVSLMLVVVLACFIVSEITRNYSQVDKLWSLVPLAYGWLTVAAYPSARIILMATLVTIWGLRLSFNFYRKGGYSIIPWQGEEDYRWKILRDSPALKGRLRFGLFNLFFISFYQNLLIMLFSTPLLMAALYNDAPLGVTDLIAAALMLLFIVTETIADNQQFRFQNAKRSLTEDDPALGESLRKGFLTEGLWKYVRHPNFASEQAIWISFYLFSVAASGQWINFTLIGPVLLVILFIGSSMMTEKISSGKYPDYQTYQKEVPKFVPRLFRRK